MLRGHMKFPWGVLCWMWKQRCGGRLVYPEILASFLLEQVNRSTKTSQNCILRKNQLTYYQLDDDTPQSPLGTSSSLRNSTSIQSRHLLRTRQECGSIRRSRSSTWEPDMCSAIQSWSPGRSGIICKLHILQFTVSRDTAFEGCKRRRMG